MKFEIYKDGSNQWRWRLLARNGRIIATSNESFERRAGALKGIQSVKKCSQAKVVEVFADAEKSADEGAAFESSEVEAPKPVFALYDQKSVPRDDEKDFGMPMRRG